MKNNFKKLTRDEQLMVNGGEFSESLWCKVATGCFNFPVQFAGLCGPATQLEAQLIPQVCGWYTGQQVIRAGGRKDCIC
jgi:hypothetical protein